MNDDVRYYGNPMNWESTKGDIISREALKKDISEKLCDKFDKWNKTITVSEFEAVVKEVIDNAPTVEVPENAVNCILTMFGNCSYNKTGCSNCEIKDKIRKALEERPQGEWKDVGTTIEGIPIYSCSICHREIYTYSLVGFPFCHCGADMRGDKE